MFGYVKKSTLLDEIQEEIDFCWNVIKTQEGIIEALRSEEGADATTIQRHETFLADWKTRWHQSRRILSMLERAQ